MAAVRYARGVVAGVNPVTDERTHLAVQRVADLVANAEALLIMAGAGMGVVDADISVLTSKSAREARTCVRRAWDHRCGSSDLKTVEFAPIFVCRFRF